MNKPSGHINKCTIYKGNSVVEIYNTRTRHVTDKEGKKITQYQKHNEQGHYRGISYICKPGLRNNI